jgi:proton glutamate symport protein
MLLAAAGGAALGLFAPVFSQRLEFISNIFLRLIQSIIAPVLFGVLVRAVGGAAGMRALGRIGWKSIVCFEVATTIALLLGWVTVAVWRPGDGLALAGATPEGAQPLGFASVLENAAPTSIVDAMARGDVLQIVVFCLLFGLACLSLGEKARPIVEFADALAEVAFRYTHYVMLLAPAAVLAAVASTIARSGSGTIEGLAKFIAAAWAAQALFLIVVLGGGLALFGVPIGRFIRFAKEPFVVAFATTSSAAALPQTLENMELFGVPKRVLGMVAPLSLSLNLNGSTIHLAMAALFVAQAAGIELSLERQLLILLTLKLTSKGVAGIPRANFVILTGLFESFGLPLEGLTMLLGVDALIDPVRTSVNVVSHCAAPAWVARWEGATFPRGNAAVIRHDEDRP